MFKDIEQSQLELFNDLKRPQKGYLFFKKKFVFPRHAISFIVHYENLVLFIIGLVLALVISFSIGVERGKRSRLSIQNAPVSKNIPNQTKRIIAVSTANAVSLKQNEIKASPDSINTQVSNTDSKDSIQPVVRKARAHFIQVVTYTNKVLAEKEKEKLLRIGISSFINLSDRFYQVKAGPFYNKDDALNLQRELKKTYKDCYITVINRQSSTVN